MSTPSFNDWNKQIIDTFRANSGAVPNSQFADATIVLLHTVGAKSGQERVNPLNALPLEDGKYAVFASKGGQPTNPDWYHNLLKNPDVSFEVGTQTVKARARVAEGEERDRLWTTQKTNFPGFAEYEKATTRTIPVVVLEPVQQSA